MNTVKICWLGHSCFRMEFGDWSLVIDPYADGSVDGLGSIRQSADAVFCSHSHSDHSAAENVTLSGRPAPEDFTVETVEVAHDHHGGEKRGMNKIHIFTFGQRRIVHMGDTGSVPGEEVLKKLRGCDLLLIPIGGFFTIDGAEALEIVRAAHPRGDPDALPHRGVWFRHTRHAGRFCPGLHRSGNRAGRLRSFAHRRRSLRTDPPSPRHAGLSSRLKNTVCPFGTDRVF